MADLPLLKKRTPLVKPDFPWASVICSGVLFLVVAFFPFLLSLSSFPVDIDPLIIAILIVFVVSLIWACCFLSKSFHSRSHWQVALFLFLSAFSIRMFTVYLFNAFPSSDFNVIFNYASIDMSDPQVAALEKYLSIHRHLGSYAIVLRTWFSIFRPSVIYGGLLNALATSLIPPILYLGLNKKLGRMGAGLAAVFYAVFPTSVIYTTVLSNENISQLFFAICLVCFVRWFDIEKLSLRYILWVVVGGISLGFLDFFKPLFLFIVVPLAIVFVLFQVIPAIWRSLRTKQLHFATCGVRLCALLLIVAIGKGVSNASVDGLHTAMNQTDVHTSYSSSDSYAKAIYRGLARDGGGVWNEDVTNRANDIVENTPKDEQVRAFYNELKKEYEGDGQALLNLMWKKAVLSWGDQRQFFYWATYAAFDATNQYEKYDFIHFPNFFYIALCLLCSLYFIAGGLRAFSRKRVDWFAVCLAAIIFVAAVVFLLLEAQVRYKSTFFPLFCIAAAGGLQALVQGLKLAKKHGVLTLAKLRNKTTVNAKAAGVDKTGGISAISDEDSTEENNARQEGVLDEPRQK